MLTERKIIPPTFCANASDAVDRTNTKWILANIKEEIRQCPHLAIRQPALCANARDTINRTT